MSFSDFGTIETKRIQVDEGIIAQRFGTEIRDRNLEFYAGDASHPNQRISFNVHDGSVYTSVLTLDGNGFTIDKLVTQGGDSGLESKDGSNVMGKMQITHYTNNTNPYAGKMVIALNNGLGDVDVHDAMSVTPDAARFHVPYVDVSGAFDVNGLARTGGLHVHRTSDGATEIARFTHAFSTDSVRIVQCGGADDMLEILGNLNASRVIADVVFAGDVSSSTATITALNVSDMLRFTAAGRTHNNGWIMKPEQNESATNILLLNETGGGVVSIGGDGLHTEVLHVGSSLVSDGDAMFSGGVHVRGAAPSGATLFHARNTAMSIGDAECAVRIVDIDSGASTSLHAPVTHVREMHAMHAHEGLTIVSREGLVLECGDMCAGLRMSWKDGALCVSDNVSNALVVSADAFSLSSDVLSYSQGTMTVNAPVLKVSSVVVSEGCEVLGAAHIEAGTACFEGGLRVLNGTSRFGGDIVVDGEVRIGSSGHIIASKSGDALEIRDREDALAVSVTPTAVEVDRSILATAGVVIANGDLLVTAGWTRASGGVSTPRIVAPLVCGLDHIVLGSATTGLQVSDDLGRTMLRLTADRVHTSGSLVVSRPGSVILRTTECGGDDDDVAVHNKYATSVELKAVLLEGSPVSCLSAPLHVAGALTISPTPTHLANGGVEDGPECRMCCDTSGIWLTEAATGVHISGVRVSADEVRVEGGERRFHAHTVHSDGGTLWIGSERVDQIDVSMGGGIHTASRLVLGTHVEPAQSHWLSPAHLHVVQDTDVDEAVCISTSASRLDVHAAGVRCNAAEFVLQSFDGLLRLQAGGSTLTVSRAAGVCIETSEPLTVAAVRTHAIHARLDEEGEDVCDHIDVFAERVVFTGSIVSEEAAARSVRAARVDVEDTLLVGCGDAQQTTTQLTASGVDASRVRADTILASNVLLASVIASASGSGEGRGSLREEDVEFGDKVEIQAHRVRISSSTTHIDGDVEIRGETLRVPSMLESTQTLLRMSTSGSGLSLVLDDEDKSGIFASACLHAPEVRTSHLRSDETSGILVAASKLVVAGDAGGTIILGDGSTLSMQEDGLHIDATDHVVICDRFSIEASTGRLRIGTSTVLRDSSARAHIVSETLDSSTLFLESRSCSCILRLASRSRGYDKSVVLGDDWHLSARALQGGHEEDEDSDALGVFSSNNRDGVADLEFLRRGLASFHVPVSIASTLSVGDGGLVVSAGGIRLEGGDMDVLGGSFRCVRDISCVGELVVRSSLLDDNTIDPLKIVLTTAPLTARILFPRGKIHFDAEEVLFLASNALSIAPDIVRVRADLDVSGFRIRNVAPPLLDTDAVNQATLNAALAALYTSDNVFPAPIYLVPKDDHTLRDFGIGFGIATSNGQSSRKLDFLVGKQQHGGLTFKRSGDNVDILSVDAQAVCVITHGDMRVFKAIIFGTIATSGNSIQTTTEGFLGFNNGVLCVTTGSTADVRIISRLGISNSSSIPPLYRIHVRDTNDDIVWVTTTNTRARIVAESTSESTSNQAMYTCRDAKSGNVFSSGYAASSDAFVIASSTDLVSNTHLVIYRTKNEAILAADLRLRRKDGGVAAVRLEDSTTSATLARFDPSGLKLRNTSITEIVDASTGDVQIAHSLGGLTKLTVHKAGANVAGHVAATSFGVGGLATLVMTTDKTALSLDTPFVASQGVRATYVCTNDFVGFNAYRDSLGNFRHVMNGDAMTMALRKDGQGNPVADITFSAVANTKGNGTLVTAEGTPAMRLSQRGLAVGTHDILDSVLHISGDVTPQLKISNPGVGDGSGVSCVLGCTETGALSIKTTENKVVFSGADLECESLRASTFMHIGPWRFGFDTMTKTLRFEVLDISTGRYHVKYELLA